MITLSSFARNVRRLYEEQAYAWERFFRAGLPDPAQARKAAAPRRSERELSVR